MNVTNCPTEDVLLDYIAGRLDPAQAARFERHADQCAHCAALRTAQAAVWLSLDEWKPAPVSEGFNRELWRRIDADAESVSWIDEWTKPLAAALNLSLWKRVAPLVFAMGLVVTAYVFDHSASHPAPQTNPGAPIVVTASDADQLDQALDDIQLLRDVDAASSAPAKPESKVM
jgi:anti-sigma factor RsiW